MINLTNPEKNQTGCYCKEVKFHTWSDSMLEAECSRVGTEICNHTTNYIAGNLKITQKKPHPYSYTISRVCLFYKLDRIKTHLQAHLYVSNLVTH